MKTSIGGRFQILKNIAGYSTSAALGQALGLISGFVVARLLGPSNVYSKVAVGHPITEMEPFAKPGDIEST
jgi:hypothetical protein